MAAGRKATASERPDPLNGVHESSITAPAGDPTLPSTAALAAGHRYPLDGSYGCRDRLFLPWREVGVAFRVLFCQPAFRKVLEDAGIKFIDRNKSGGPGVRLRA